MSKYSRTTLLSIPSSVLGCFCLGGLTLLAGCHSAFVQATVVNHTGGPVQLFEVDYPQASFGSGPLQAGASFHYRFKISGDGSAQVTWVDGAEHEHKVKGPLLHEGEEGTLLLQLNASTAEWTPNLHARP